MQSYFATLTQNTCLYPVSYTHLDVYKRQLHASCEQYLMMILMMTTMMMMFIMVMTTMTTMITLMAFDCKNLRSWLQTNNGGRRDGWVLFKLLLLCIFSFIFSLKMMVTSCVSEALVFKLFQWVHKRSEVWNFNK